LESAGQGGRVQGSGFRMRGTQAGEEGRCGAMGEKGAEGKTPRVGKGFFLKPGT